jgi:hypothetical protein
MPQTLTLYTTLHYNHTTFQMLMSAFPTFHSISAKVEPTQAG